MPRSHSARSARRAPPPTPRWSPTDSPERGSTSAWSRKAADGYHLVVAHGGVAADAPVPASSAPYDPDLGPTKANGRAIVYARGGDLYRYNVGAAEQKLTALSSSATEIAPSFFRDTIVLGCR